jgi:hypothetical protein
MRREIQNQIFSLVSTTQGYQNVLDVGVYYFPKKINVHNWYEFSATRFQTLTKEEAHLNQIRDQINYFLCIFCVSCVSKSHLWVWKLHSCVFKSHFACEHRTLRVIITLKLIIIRLMRLEITLECVKTTLCVLKSHLCVLKSHSGLCSEKISVS